MTARLENSTRNLSPRRPEANCHYIVYWKFELVKSAESGMTVHSYYTRCFLLFVLVHYRVGIYFACPNIDYMTGFDRLTAQAKLFQFWDWLSAGWQGRNWSLWNENCIPSNTGLHVVFFICPPLSLPSPAYPFPFTKR